MSFAVIALYKFIRIDNPSAMKDSIEAICKQYNILGGLILAYEGINGTVAGAADIKDLFLSKLRCFIPIEDYEIKVSSSDSNPFYRMRMSVKPEIITMGCPDVDPLEKKGRYSASNTIIVLPAQHISIKLY